MLLRVSLSLTHSTRVLKTAWTCAHQVTINQKSSLFERYLPKMLNVIYHSARASSALNIKQHFKKYNKWKTISYGRERRNIPYDRRISSSNSLAWRKDSREPHQFQNKHILPLMFFTCYYCLLFVRALRREASSRSSLSLNEISWRIINREEIIIWWNILAQNFAPSPFSDLCSLSTYSSIFWKKNVRRRE